MTIYHQHIVIRANEIGLVTNEAFLDACQELMDAKGNSADIGSVFTQHIGDVLKLGDDASKLFRGIHNWKMGKGKDAK
ncbi:hypothetical protein [Cohaesibacter marisflavi]|uniref:hypothetical protein n=1 Tax=Cohaesibacter marisflavi TaxID=655353 RepID=UPI0029C643C7|nr:hypothetical protein [Cohaesibacter marisflavi]